MKSVLREKFWTPYEQMREHTGRKFEVIKQLNEQEIGDSETQGQLFEIKLEDGQTIKAWYEEIYDKSCEISGTLV